MSLTHRYVVAIKEEEYLTYDGSKPNPEYWYEYLEYNPDFQEKFSNIINDSNMPDTDADFMSDVFECTYFNKELVIPRYGDGPDFAKVRNHYGDKDGMTVSLER